MSAAMPDEKPLQAPPPPTAEERAALVHRLGANMPAAMRERRQWLLWRYEAVEGRPKLQKVPYYPGGAPRFGDLGSDDDRRRLGSFDQVLQRYESGGRHHGVGFAFLAGDGLIGIDLDEVFDGDTGEMRAHHADILDLCATFTEWSPSGKGLHLICAGDTESFKHDPVGVEVYAGGRYFTCTGNRLDSAPAEVMPLKRPALEYMRMVVDRSKERVRLARESARPRETPAPRQEDGGAGGDDFRKVNDTALQALAAWVPALFPKARTYKSGYRVTSKDLGRELEEDLQLMPEGIMDFGEDCGMSPIDCALRWGPGLATPKDAMQWLAARIGVVVSTRRPPLRVVGKEPPAYLDEVPPPEDVPVDGQGGEPPATAKGKGGGARRKRAREAPSIGDLQDGFALVYGTDQAWDYDRHALMPVKNLRLLKGSRAVTFWLESPGRKLIYPENIKFEPGVELPEGCVNLFDELPTQPVECTEDDVRPMLDLLHHLCSLSGSTPAEVDAIKHQLMQWCALMVQQPGAKSRFAVVLHGPQGTGKNLFADGLRRILGKYGKMVGQAELDDKFNGYMSGKLLLVGNEVVTRQELFHNKNKLKWVITEDEIPIRGMHMEVRWESNHANIMFLSNELMPVALEWDDRRHLVIYTPAADDPCLYTRVVDFLENDGLGKWMYHLQHYDTEGFSEHTKPLMTKAKENLIELGLKPAERFVAEWLGGVLDLPVWACSAEQLFRVFQRWCALNGERDFRGQAMFTRTAERFVKERIQLDAEGKRKPPALVYKQIAVRDPEAGSRTTVRCWLPNGTGPAPGVTEGDFAWQAIAAFDKVVGRYGRQPGGEGDS